MGPMTAGIASGRPDRKLSSSAPAACAQLPAGILLDRFGPRRTEAVLLMLAVAGSLVFTMTDRPVDLGDPSQWWRWVEGSCWRHPLGPDSGIADILDHPVVHVTHPSILFGESRLRRES